MHAKRFHINVLITSILLVATSHLLIGTSASGQVVLDRAGGTINLDINDDTVATFLRSDQLKNVLKDGNADNNVITLVAKTIIIKHKMVEIGDEAGFIIPYPTSKCDVSNALMSVRADGPVLVALVCETLRAVGDANFDFGAMAAGYVDQDIIDVSLKVTGKNPRNPCVCTLQSYPYQFQAGEAIGIPPENYALDWAFVADTIDLSSSNSELFLEVIGPPPPIRRRLIVSYNKVIQPQNNEQSGKIVGISGTKFDENMFLSKASVSLMRIAQVPRSDWLKDNKPQDNGNEAAYYVGPIAMLTEGVRRRDVVLATTAWKRCYWRDLRRRLHLAGLPGAEQPESILEAMQRTPFLAVGVEGPLADEMATEAAGLRQDLAAALPPLVALDRLVELPGGRSATIRLLTRPTDGSYRVVPHEVLVRPDAQSSLGALAQDGAKLRLALDLELAVSPAAAKAAGGGVLRYDGPQTVAVEAAACSFEGVLDTVVEDLGGNALRLRLTLDGSTGGPALARLASPDGLPVSLRLRPTTSGSESAEQIVGVSLAFRTGGGVSVGQGAVRNATNGAVYVLWLSALSGGIAAPVDGRAVLIQPGGSAELSRFASADGQNGVVPAEALEYAVPDPLGSLRREGVGLLRQVEVTNRVPAVLTVAGSQQPVDWVEVTLTPEGAGQSYGPFRLAPKGAEGSRVSVPVLAAGPLSLSGRVVLSAGGSLTLAKRPVDGASILIDENSIQP